MAASFGKVIIIIKYLFKKAFLGTKYTDDKQLKTTC